MYNKYFLIIKLNFKEEVCSNRENLSDVLFRRCHEFKSYEW